MARSDDSEIQNALLAINSRLGTIEGKINMVARAERHQILAALEEVVTNDPLVAQVYLLLDGSRTQKSILEELGRFGISTSQAVVSRRMTDLVGEYGVAEQVARGVLRKNRAAEDVLNLTRQMTGWLTRSTEIVPIEAVKKPRKSTS